MAKCCPVPCPALPATIPLSPEGPYSAAFRKQLQEDAPGVPLWPNPYDTTTPPVNSTVPREKVGWVGGGGWVEGGGGCRRM